MNLLFPSPELERAAVTGVNHGGLVILEIVLVQRRLQIRKLGFVVLAGWKSTERADHGLQHSSRLVEVQFLVRWGGQIVHCLEPDHNKFKYIITDNYQAPRNQTISKVTTPD